MSNDGGNLLPKLKELVPIYEKVKQAIFLAEYEKGLEIPLTSINELRNCLDHFMRILSDGHNINSEYEYIEAKAHLYRACNDSYEIIVMKKLTRIEEIMIEFDKEAILAIYPEYFQILIPLGSQAQRELSKSRSKKPVIHEEESTFAIYENLVGQLMQYLDKFNDMTPGILEYQKDMKRKSRKATIVNLVLGSLIGGLLVGIIMLFIEKKLF